MRTRAVMVAAISLGGILPFSAVALRAAEGPSAETVEKARTATDHAALVDRYTKEAAELRKQAEKQRGMASACKKGPRYHKVRRMRPSTIKRCRDLFHHYARAARGADLMAQMHRELAGESR